MRPSLLLGTVACLTISWGSSLESCQEAFILNGVRYSVTIKKSSTLVQVSTTLHNGSSETIYIPARFVAYTAVDHPMIALGYMGASIDGTKLGEYIALRPIPAGTTITMDILIPDQSYPFEGRHNVYIDFIQQDYLTKADIKDQSVISDQYLQSATTLVAAMNCAH